MFDVFCLSVALAVGQGSPADQSPPAPDAAKLQSSSRSYDNAVAQLPGREVRSMPITSAAGRASVGEEPVPPARIPAAIPMMQLPPSATPIPGRVQTQPTSQGGTPMMPPMMPPKMGMPMGMPMGTPTPAAPAANGNGNGNGNCATCEEKKEEELGHFMAMVKGTPIGCMLERKGITVDGWIAMSYTHADMNGPTALPLTWNDRVNRFLMQQAWVNVGKNIDTESKEFDWGWKVAFLGGTDYRYTVVRGFLDDQLKNSRRSVAEPNGFQQNIYGVDVPLFYVNAWLPNMFEGTEVTLGRMFCQFGYESVMAPVTPLMSRSYAFNWAPPFFHTGVMVSPKFNDNVSGKFMIVNGNDVFFDGSDEWRFAGQLTYANEDSGSTLSFGTSLGRGKFNSGRPTPPTQTTLGLAYEPLGRNNMNVFDLVYTQKLTEDLSYALELIYGYQTNVPATATGNANNFGGLSGNAQWGSIVNYLTYNFTEQLSGIARQEFFYDAQGQRTGFEGWYSGTTLGLQFKPTNSILFRPEVRYDCNDYSKPFGGNGDKKSGLFTAGADLIFKF
jgi:hypothetical protein